MPGLGSEIVLEEACDTSENVFTPAVEVMQEVSDCGAIVTAYLIRRQIEL